MNKSKLSFKEKNAIYEFKNILSNTSLSTFPVLSFNEEPKSRFFKMFKNILLEKIKKTSMDYLIYCTLKISLSFILYNK
ncbi:membrane protein US8A [Canid alphaherpesvirus 1]|uniref:Membrane protein US8A n=1 Tax=Canid alphaherpesvirus 1 TaxID=170325 RepID=Q9YP99_9ALPH|nr:membrane protein US8A [Canid alphaherpesvirus 1]AAC67215.1 US8.5 [Canid alphaherpesvirus 1]ALL25947.1 membrane protein US8A [Canid alphaherpesvirus 1]ALL26027.1 membrane protein US8A [Canid alphaherpesvirus 1]ALL26103.1 membrane protein US8A [Canid alphaherpesvirus 1]AQX83384.1 membrane protein US8A [Canid alphaherpesvirus 1]